jgi:hypothetical protein
MATRKLPVLALAAVVLSLAAVSTGLACKRHYRVVHHKKCTVHYRTVCHRVRVISCHRRHYRVYGGGSAKPYIVSLATVTPLPAVSLNAPPPPAPAVIPPIPPIAEVPPIPCRGPLIPPCTSCHPSCNSCQPPSCPPPCNPCCSH